MAAPIRENLQVEPAVKAAFANRELVRQNSRAQSNWHKLRKSLEKQQKEIRNELDTNKSKLLKQRERIQATTINLNTQLLPTSNSASGMKSDNGEMENLRRPFHFADVYKALMASTKSQKRDSIDQRSVSSETISIKLTKPTQSSEKKKVVRKPMGFSLSQMQRDNSNLSSRLKNSQDGESIFEQFDDAATEDEPERTPGLLELNEDDESLGPLYLPPVMLPPIRNQFVHKPQGQNFEKNSKEYKKRLNNPCTIDDVRYCRYLRSGRRTGRRHSAPVKVETISRESVYRKDSY